MLSLQQQLKSENVRYLLNNGRLVALMMGFYSLLWWLLFSPSLSSKAEAAWLLAMLSVIVCFYLFLVRQLRLEPNQHGSTELSVYFSFSTSIGVLWGVGILLFVPLLTEEQRLLLILLVAGLFPLVVVPNILSIASFNGFSVPVMLALSVAVLDVGRNELLACVVLWLSLLCLNVLLRRAQSLLRANFTESFKNRAKVAELSSSNAAMRQRSERDALTGLYNRAMFEDVLAQYWRFSGRAQTNLSLLLIDVDFFKPYNDHYGHVAGDQCLRLVAHLLEKALPRKDDLVARYGGEEFVMVLPNTDTKGALQVAERVRSLMHEAELRHEYSAAASHVTVSIGVACLIPDNQQNSLTILDKADKALYRAKELGRNQAVVSARGD